EVLLALKDHLEADNPIYRGAYARWNASDSSPCNWPGITCTGAGRVDGVYLAESNISSEIFSNFSLLTELTHLDLSANTIRGSVPADLNRCSRLEYLNLSSNIIAGELTSLNLWGNAFTGAVPSGIGSLSELSALNLGNNSFDRNIPEELLNCSNLVFLDFSNNSFGGDIQEIFGRFATLNYLILHGNHFSGNLLVEITTMPKLKILILAYNGFSGLIPPEFGRMAGLQLLDLSHNNLTGSIPPAIGNLTSLLWLMLAKNDLTGEIPPEIGNCSSLLWLNLANNRLSGGIPPELSAIGRNPAPTFEANRREIRGVAPGSGDCPTMKRWIPASYPPFNFIYTLMTRQTCRTTWDRLLKGYEIGRMRNLSLIHLDANQLSGRLPPEIGGLPLVILNISDNRLSGEIPTEIGGLRCLSSLDLSRNNFSGELPPSLCGLSELNKFNVSYNPLLSGTVPVTGQMATFDRDSFLGDPLIGFPSLSGRGARPPSGDGGASGGHGRWTTVAFWVLIALTSIFVACGVLSIAAFRLRGPHSAVEPDPEELLRDGVKRRSDAAMSVYSSSSDGVGGRVFRLDSGEAELAFTYGDILAATGKFDERSVVGRGGCGVVYRGVLQDGRCVAVKKMQRRMGKGELREGEDAGEREFRAEMEVMAGARGRGHPNLVRLYGWCLAGEAALLVYEYMEGGSLEEVIEDWGRFGWQRRLGAATGVARALAFLHHDCVPAVVHRDVKASNVMLDAWGRARVTDFGLARSVGAGESHVSTVVAGTVGYVAPEYGQTWRATTRGDVYSYGVLAMEMATGRRVVDGGEECLVERVRRAAEAEWGLRAGEEEGAAEMLALLTVGLRCTADAPHARPDMMEVLAELLSIADRNGGTSETNTPCWSLQSHSTSPSSVQSYWEGYF
ncbi:LRR receptor-like serine threonine-protein kinase, partial [Musa troglodytarum]